MSEQRSNDQESENPEVVGAGGARVWRLPLGTDAATEGYLVARLDRPETAPAERETLPTVLYLHGLGSSQEGDKARFFRSRFLAAGFAFCSLDFQGHGQSDGGIFGLSLSRNLRDVALVRSVLHRKQPGPVILVGSSMGGITALWHALQQSSGVVAVLAVAPAVELAEGLQRAVGEEGMASWRSTGRYRFAGELLSAELGWGLMEDLESYPRRELERGLRVPSLLLQGRRDTSVSWRAVTEFAGGCDRAPVELHLFGDGDHRLLSYQARLFDLMMGFVRPRLGAAMDPSVSAQPTRLGNRAIGATSERQT